MWTITKNHGKTWKTHPKQRGKPSQQMGKNHRMQQYYCWLPPTFIISNKTGKSKNNYNKIRTAKKATANSKKPRMPHHSKAPLLKEHRVSTVTYSITQWPGPHQHLFHSSFFPLADRSNSAMVKGVDNMLIKEQIHKFDIISACATPSSSHQFLQITETCPEKQSCLLPNAANKGSL